jgi:predicted metal-binding membrane protein
MQCVRACHQSIPLPLSGIQAIIADITFGVRNAFACVGSCWGMMVAMLLVPASHFLWTIFFTGMVTLEKMSLKPLSSVRYVFFALGAAAIALVWFI